MTGRRRRATKLKNNSDYFSQMPDDILYKITSMLDVKDAAKTSILSKNWRYVWVNRDDFTFNHFSILGLNYNQLQEKWEGLDTIFVNFVDQIMQQRIKGRTTIKCFSLQFELGKKFSHYIDRWIRYAIRNGLETLDLDMSVFSFNLPTPFSSHQSFDIYNFWLPRTVSENKGSLKHMRLVFCKVHCRSSFQKFDSLVSLHLESVDISSFQMTKVLESCPSLEKLIMWRCSSITNLRNDNGNNNRLKILSLKDVSLTEIDICANHLISFEMEKVYLSSSKLIEFIKSCPLLEELTLDNCWELTNLKMCDSNNTHLKILSLKKCFNLNEIDLCVSNLHTFEYVSEGILLSFKIKAPRLVNAFISEFTLSRFLAPKMCLNIPMLENLVLLVKFPLKVFKFQNKILNVRRLNMCDYSLFNHDRSPLIYYILKCLPLLQTLELKRSRRKNEDIERNVIEKCPNGTITKLILNGYSENREQIDLIKYLLENLTGLKELVVGPLSNQYASLDGSVSSVIRCDWNWLYQLIPPSVRLLFLSG